MSCTEWSENGYEAEYFTPYLCLTAPDGRTALVQLKDDKRRNITLQQFRSSVASHGIEKACSVFFMLDGSR